MEMKELMRKSAEELEKIEHYFLSKQELNAAYAVGLVRDFGNKRVKVVKGRKVPKGTEGVCFWMGSTCYSPYGDPWGIYTSYRCGIKDDSGNVFWTAVDNIALAEV